jgi:hypothetical protein
MPESAPSAIGHITLEELIMLVVAYLRARADRVRCLRGRRDGPPSTAIPNGHRATTTGSWSSATAIHDASGVTATTEAD